MTRPSPKLADDLHFAVLAADTALFTIRDGELCVRLIRIDRAPFYKNAQGMPGGLLAPTETAEEAALRHLTTKTGVANPQIYMEQLYTFSRVDRDRRGRVVAVAYMALVPWSELSPEEQADTTESWWEPVRGIGTLAYDHDEMLATALARLRSRVTYTTVMAKLMPSEFTLTELEQAYARILKSSLDKRNFRKKILKLKVVKPTGKKRSTGRSRPAELFRFTSKKVTEIEVL